MDTPYVIFLNAKNSILNPSLNEDNLLLVPILLFTKVGNSSTDKFILLAKIENSVSISNSPLRFGKDFTKDLENILKPEKISLVFIPNIF